MAEPKKKLSATRSGRRRSHLALTVQAPAQCTNCKALVTPHTVCVSCGFYKGKQVLPKNQAK
ncbi:MAG TPA: 50S ribosomal protein L32 [Patescibacteria group bacterium]